MATGHALAHGSGKIPFEVGEMRAGNVVFLIDAGAVGRVFEGETAVEDQQVGFAEAGGQLLRG